MHEVLVNRLGGLSLPRKSVDRLTDRPDMTLDVYRGRKKKINKSSKLALNRSSEFKGVIVQIVCDAEIQIEFAWALANITSGTT